MMATVSDLEGIGAIQKIPYLIPRISDACVYFLVSNSEVMYVGQTIRFPARLGEHITTKPPFDSVYILPTPVRKLTKVESYYIAEFNPPWNGGFGGEFRFSTIDGGKISLPRRNSRDEQAARVSVLERNISGAVNLLYHAMSHDRMDIVGNVVGMLQDALAGRNREILAIDHYRRPAKS